MNLLCQIGSYAWVRHINFNLPACYIRYIDHVCLPITTPGKKTELKAGVKSGGGGGGGATFRITFY